MKIESEGGFNGDIEAYPRIYRAKYGSFGSLVGFVESEIGRTLTFTERTEIQALLGAPWPRRILNYC